MKIVLVTHVARETAAGAAYCALSMVEQWRSEGHTVIDAFGDELPRLPLGRLTPDAAAMWALPFIVRKARGADVLIITGPLGWATFQYYGWFRAGPRPTTVCVTYGLEHDDYEVQRQEVMRGEAELSFAARMRWKMVLRPALECSIRRADRFFAARESPVRRAVTEGWKARSEVLSHGWGVDPLVFGVPTKRSAEWGGKIAWCGTTVDRKGWRYFRDGMILLARTMPEMSVDVFGTRHVPEVVKAQFPREVAERVHVHGVLSRAEQFGLMAEADAFVSTSLSEGYHLALQEAMALGVPCVATDEGFVADLAPTDRPVLEIPKRSPDAVAEAIENLATSPDLRAALSSRGIAWGSAHTWASTCEAVLEGCEH